MKRAFDEFAGRVSEQFLLIALIVVIALAVFTSGSANRPKKTRSHQANSRFTLTPTKCMIELGAFPSAFTVEAPCITPLRRVNGVLDTFRLAGTPTFCAGEPFCILSPAFPPDV
jgi:hypothetical protein